MVKTAPLKKRSGKFFIVPGRRSFIKHFSTAVSVHSRASKRASSPSIDTDKSLKNVKPPIESKKARPSILAVHQGAGVSKKSKIGRKSVLSAKAKRRQEKGMDMAEAIMDKKEKKIEKSRGRARTAQERAKAWEELNKKILAKQADKEAFKKETLVEMVQEQMEVEEDIESEVSNRTANAPAIEGMTEDPNPRSIRLPDPTPEEEEEL